MKLKIKLKKKLNEGGKWIKNGGWFIFLDIEELYGDFESISVFFISGVRSDIIGMVCFMFDGENDGEYYSDYYDDFEELMIIIIFWFWFCYYFFFFFWLN